MAATPRPGVPGEWADRASCRGYPVSWWFPVFEEFAGKSAREARADAAVAMRICAELCPVRVDCLRHALEHRECGIWGATTEKQRQVMRVRGGWAA